jgi:DNA repair protein RadD
VTVTLRPNQIAAADAVEDAFRRDVNRPLVDSCVGSGKSLIMAEVARRAWLRGERSIIGAHTRELVEQNAAACRALGLQVGINAAALGERCWRAPVISAAIQSVYKNAQAFGPISLFLGDECHLWPHAESGMYRSLIRDLRVERAAGFSGTVFRLQGGSLVEGEAAPFDEVVYRYGIVDGIRDEYLVPAFSAPALDKIDPAKLKSRSGEYTGESQDAQNIDLMDNHIAQMLQHGENRRAWLVFEASTKAAKAMCARLNEWRVPTGLVLGETPAAERAATIAAFRAGRLRCLVNVAALTTGFDVQTVDMLVMRRLTKSLGLYIQMCGRLLRTIGGTLATSIAAGKADGIVLDFAGNISLHGPLDFIRPKDVRASLVSCDECGKRNSQAAARCWFCDAVMTKLCPACLEAVAKGTLDCPHCAHDMRAGAREEGKGPKLLDTPSGAALISAYRPGVARAGGWQPVRKVWEQEGVRHVVLASGETYALPEALREPAKDARWMRSEAGHLTGLLVPNGLNRTSVRMWTASGEMLVIPMPPGVVSATESEQEAPAV